jgi:hypothetical protein
MAAKKAKSGKRSSGKSATRPKKFTAYLDAAVGCHEVMVAFRREKIKFQLHLDHFRPNTSDTTWLPVVGKHKWVLLTTDDRMQHRAAEAAAIKQYKVRSFVYKSQFQGQDMAKFLIRMMPEMRQFCGKHDAPFIGFLYPKGDIKLILDKYGLVGGHLADIV